jgi:hypothetical protein
MSESTDLISKAFEKYSSDDPIPLIPPSCSLVWAI